MKKLPILLLLCTLVFLLFSCSDYQELTPEQALEMLSKEFEVTCDKRLITTTTSVSQDSKSIIKKAEELSNIGLIKIDSKFYPGFGGGGHTKYYFSPTKALKSEFQVSNKTYAITKSKVVEINGISQNKEGMMATVSFEYIMEPTIIYDFRGFVNGRRENCSTKKEQTEAQFILYDTGWQLKK